MGAGAVTPMLKLERVGLRPFYRHEELMRHHCHKAACMVLDRQCFLSAADRGRMVECGWPPQANLFSARSGSLVDRL